jgi:ribosomal protein S13
MNKINYPKDSKELLKFEQSYRDCLDKSKIVEINKHLNKITYNGKSLDFDSLVTFNFEDLIDMIKCIESYLKKLDATKKAEFESLFDYKANQPKIATFFMQKSYFNFKTCHYCGIDYINAFTDLNDYFDGLDFLNRADIYDLQIVKGIGKERAQSIIDKRNISKFSDIDEIGLTKNIREKIKRFDFKNGHNHFTLDHVIPQKTHKFYSLCLYNFVPSCFSCNSKFKKAKEFILNDDLKKISPTSNLYSFTDDFKFKLYYKRELKKIKTNSDFVVEKTILSNDAQIRQFLSIFKINGRYVFHKDLVLRLVEKKILYPNTKIKELSKETGKSIEVIKKEIFGEELFDKLNSDLPFIKLKKDIAKQLKIIK